MIATIIISVVGILGLVVGLFYFLYRVEQAAFNKAELGARKKRDEIDQETLLQNEKTAKSMPAKHKRNRNFVRDYIGSFKTRKTSKPVPGSE